LLEEVCGKSLPELHKALNFLNTYRSVNSAWQILQSMLYLFSKGV
jgi:hypothetical protein